MNMNKSNISSVLGTKQYPQNTFSLKLVIQELMNNRKSDKLVAMLYPTIAFLSRPVVYAEIIYMLKYE